MRVVVRTALYYVVMFAAGAAIWRWLPHGGAFAPASLQALIGAGGDAPAAATIDTPASPELDEISLAITVGVAMISAVLLALPVAWIYLLTRRKRGYQQSVVQLLLMLPAVVAGVVVLVKYSVALAFSLAGIVAAVRFRNSLEDSKDAVYVFLATAVGLAAAVNLPVAAVLSLLFNTLMLMLWYTDFGSAPVELDGRIAERRLERARKLARTGTFVARMDEEVFGDMTREQLQGVAERAWKRAAAVTGEEPVPVPVVESRLRIHTGHPDAVRRAVEPRLAEFTKRWRFAGAYAPAPGTDGGGDTVIEYVVQLRKKVPGDALLALVRTAGGSAVRDAELH